MLIYLTCIAALVFAYRERIAFWGLFVTVHTAVIGLLVGFVFFAGEPRKSACRWLRDWYPILLLLPLFDELSFLIHPIHPKDYDSTLALLDYRLFGFDPVAWLQQFARPWLTEVLQLAYVSFYLLPIGLLLALYLAQRMGEFRKAQFGILLCFFLSYLGYFIVPALGPRFVGEGLIDSPSGLFVTGWLQEALNRIERAGDMRDVFPSGHAAVALLVQWYAFRWFPRRALPLLLLTSALLLSTVYLGYHYVVDVIAGAILAAFCIAVTARAVANGNSRSAGAGSCGRDEPRSASGVR